MMGNLAESLGKFFCKELSSTGEVWKVMEKTMVVILIPGGEICFAKNGWHPAHWWICSLQALSVYNSVIIEYPVATRKVFDSDFISDVICNQMGNFALPIYHECIRYTWNWGPSSKSLCHHSVSVIVYRIENGFPTHILLHWLRDRVHFCQLIFTTQIDIHSTFFVF